MNTVAVPDLPPASYPVDASFSPGGRLLAWCYSGGQWGMADADNGRLLRHGSTGAATRRVRFSADGRHLAVATAGRLHLWAVDPWAAIGDVDTGQDGCALAFTPDGATAIVFGGGHVVGGWEQAKAAFAARRAVPRFADGKVVFVSVAEARVTTTVDPRLPRTGIGRQNFTALAVSPDGERIAWGESTALLVADARTGGLAWTVTAHPAAVGTVAFSPDGRTLASTDGGQIGLWDADTGHRRQLIRPEDGVRELAFTPDGQAVVGVATADHLDLWWTADGSLRERVAAAGAQGQAIAVAPDGRSIAFGRFGIDGPPSIGVVPLRPGEPPPAVKVRPLSGDVPPANRAMADGVAAANRSAPLRSGPPPLDLARFGAFAPLARVAVRLHPRRSADVDPRTSHVGGPVLWPAGEPWPACPDHAEPLAVVAQLRRADLPELPFPTGTDLCQLFWCGRAHGDRRQPRPMVVWRGTTADLSPRSAPLPFVADTTPVWRPAPCAVWPERIVDYPGDREDIEAVAPGAFDRAEAAHPEMADYAGSLGAAPGFKVGGHPRWVQDPEVPMCATCRRPMRLLLQAGGWEFDGHSGRRWRPAEPDPATNAERLARVSPTVAVYGDGSVFLFICPECDPSQAAAIHQQ